MSESAPEIASSEATDSTAIDPVAETPSAGAPADRSTDTAVSGEADVAGTSGDNDVVAEQAPEAAEVAKPSKPALPPRKLVLLVEPDGPVRGSVVEMARALAHVSISPFSSVDLGEEYMKGHRIKALLLSVGEGAEPMDFLARLRRGECPCDADIPVVVMAHTCDAKLVGQLKEYGVSRLLIEPFKLGDMAHTLEQLWEIKVDIPPQKPVPDAGAMSSTAAEAESVAAPGPSEEAVTKVPA